MYINGRITICDRCGKRIFSKCVGEGEADGGFTRWNKFEDNLDGWNVAPSIGMLCPDCYEEYEYMIQEFSKKTTNKKEADK